MNSECRWKVMEKRQGTIWRYIFYGMGLIVLAIGITLNTKTGLGVSPIISVPFVISSIWGLNFAAMTFVVYSIQVGIQFLLKGKNREWKDILQIPFSLVFSFFLNLFGEALDFHYELMWQKLLLLAAAVIVTAVGAAMVVDMKLVPNPADGLAQTVGESLHKEMGFGKNVIDLISVVLTCIIGVIFYGKITAIGIGTVVAMIGVGRFIALFNYLFKKPMMRMAGLE